MSVACASARILTPSPMVAPEKNGAPPRRAPLRNTSDAIARTGSRPDAPICEFGDFAVNYLSSLHCGDSAPLAAHVLRAAAEAHVFRFDPALPADFVRERIARASSALVSRAHLPPAAARHWLHCALRDAAHAYFDTRWARVPAVVVANTPVVARLRRAALQSHDIVDDDAAPDARIARLPPHAIAHLVAPGRPVLLNVFTQYCSKCAALEPIFDAAASDPERPARFAAIDASLHPEARALFAVTVFPTVLLLQHGLDPVVFPRAMEPTVSRLLAFARGADPASADGDCGDKTELASSTAHGPESGLHPALGQWAAMLARQGIDELDALVRDRDILVHMRIDEAIQCGGSSCEVLPPRETSALPPVCILLGGGMGAGKTTAVSAIAHTAFWDAHGANVVCVEADAFKEQDPFFHVLNSVTQSASRVVHADSIAAAETLFLEAVNRRRDVVFDGTLSWAEYARQTVAMLRDGTHEYARGPGYAVAPDGTVTEKYWRRARRRQTPVAPYRVELVAVTVDAPSAVARGVVREVLSGRGVAVADQLRSHALFSSHFEEYTRLVDASYLFDMTEAGLVAHDDDDSDDDDRCATAEIIAIQPGVLFGGDGVKPSVHQSPPKAPFAVKNRAAYKRFLRKQWINTHAKCADELYPTSSVGSEDSQFEEDID